MSCGYSSHSPYLGLQARHDRSGPRVDDHRVVSGELVDKGRPEHPLLGPRNENGRRGRSVHLHREPAAEHVHGANSSWNCEKLWIVFVVAVEHVHLFFIDAYTIIICCEFLYGLNKELLCTRCTLCAHA